jgi:sterol desaturase/sphingolipid hydroxylase (fatty acid hydroxylase superfamily)
MQEFVGGLLHTIGYLAVVYAAMSIIERFAPAERGQPIQRTFFNLALTPLLLAISGALVIVLTPLIQPAVAGPLGRLLEIQFPDGVAGSFLAAFALFFVLDFFYYWWHRLQHTNSWLWEQHALHHSERSLNVCASLRHHWLEDPLRVFFQMLPFGFFFHLEQPSVGWVAMLVGLWPFFIHMNLRLDMGPLTAVLAGPQYHRIHHSILPQHRDRNFAAVFPFWDILFRTAHLPARDEFPPTGIEGVEIQRFSTALFSPFVEWTHRARRLIADRAGT